MTTSGSQALASRTQEAVLDWIADAILPTTLHAIPRKQL
jgi:hypothetical protein